MNRLFVLREQPHFDQMVAVLRANWLAFSQTGKPLGIHVAPYRKKRSDEQNALMWVWIDRVTERAWMAGRQFSDLIWNEHFKRELLPATTAKGVEKWSVLPNGERALAMSTTDLNIDEMRLYLDALDAYIATELGVDIT